MCAVRLVCLLALSLGAAWASSGCSHLLQVDHAHANVSETDFVGSWEGEGVLDWRTNTFCRLELMPRGKGVCVENFSVEWPSTTVYRITQWQVNQWGCLVGTMRAMGETSQRRIRLVGTMERGGLRFAIAWSPDGADVAHLSKVPALRDQMRILADQAKGQRESERPQSTTEGMSGSRISGAR